MSISSLTADNMNEWIDVYNQEMKRVHGFIPLSRTKFEHMLPLLEKHGAELMLAIEGQKPSAVCSYIIDHQKQNTRMLDLVVLSLHPKGGLSLMDSVLTKSRNLGMKQMICWTPVSLGTSLDVLGEYLFTPEVGAVLMKNEMKVRPPAKDIDVVDHCSSGTSEMTLLPLREPLQIRSLLYAYAGHWNLAITTHESGPETGLDVYLSSKLRRESWVFNRFRNGTPSEECLMSTLRLLYDRGVRVVYTEIEVGYHRRTPFDTCGFCEISTEFEMTFSFER
jgi:hypothetical protein